MNSSWPSPDDPLGPNPDPDAAQRDASTATPAEFRAAMRQFPAGVAIITAGRGADRRGMTVTSVCSLSADPPSMLACVNKRSGCHTAILASRRFAINLLAGQHRSLAERFAGRSSVRGAERFMDGPWEELPSGATVLRDALAVFDCTLRDAVDGGSHSIIIGDVASIQVRPGERALFYRCGAFLATEPAAGSGN